MNPKISVIMPVYNSEKFLKEAIESILNQSFKDFEFIILNDGSSDSSEEIIKTFSDQRIIYIKNEQNVGLPKVLNQGIRQAKGDFIARMDADDVSLKERLALQYKFLTNHPEIDIIGTNVRLINAEGLVIGTQKKPAEHWLIKWQSLFSTPLQHPTVMARAKVFRENLFDENLYNGEDYELWSRLLFKTRTRFANISQPLLQYRIYPESFTRKLTPLQKSNSSLISIRNIEHYLKLSEKEKGLINDLRQAKQISLFSIYLIYLIDLKIGLKYSVAERLNTLKIIRLIQKLAQNKWFLIKYWLKHLKHPN